MSENKETKKQWKVADFNLGRALGKGRFGNVYLAREKKTNYVVALKIMFKKDIRDAELQHQVIFDLKYNFLYLLSMNN